MIQAIPTTTFRITLKSFEKTKLNVTCQKIISTVESLNCSVTGVVKLPTRIKRFCVLRSPHVDKDSREHFDIRFSKRILEIHTKSAYVIDRLMRLKLPPGVLISVTILANK